MSLYKDWQKLLDSQTDETFEAFWKEYSEAEEKIYAYILSHHTEHVKGVVSELAEKYGCTQTIFAGFLDGVNDSLNNKFTDEELEAVSADTAIDLDIDFRTLLFNMFKVDASHLFSLEEWAQVFTEDEMQDILKEYRRSRTVHVEKKPGRNDPCPCGSGKKYKNCCGKNA